METVHSVDDLRRMSQSDRDNDVINGNRNTLVSGVLVREEFSNSDHNIEQRRFKGLYKEIGNSLETKRKLVTA